MGINLVDLLDLTPPPNILSLFIYTWENKLSFNWRDYKQAKIDYERWKPCLHISYPDKKIIGSSDLLRLYTRLTTEQAQIHSFSSWFPPKVKLGLIENNFYPIL